LDFLFGFLFAGYDTTSIAITMAVKYLMETPRALHELREEREEILRRKRRKNGSETVAISP
jgi:cytochrome P450 family 90 subfamily A polypeptide 1